MGLTAWKNAPAGPARKGDVAIAKNDLAKEQIEALNLIVSAYRDFAELQARNRKPMHMADGIAKLDDFIRLGEGGVLTHAGRISHQQAEEHAHAQYDGYDRQSRELEAAAGSDFDEAAKRIGDQATPPRPRRRKKRPDGGG